MGAGGNGHRHLRGGGRASLRAARKRSGGAFSGPLFIRPKAVEQGRPCKGSRLEIGPRLPGWRGYAPAGGRQARPDLTRVKSGKQGLRLPLTPSCRNRHFIGTRQLVNDFGTSKLQIRLVDLAKFIDRLQPFGGGRDSPDDIHHTITPTAARPRSARRLRASRSMQAIRTATPIST